MKIYISGPMSGLPNANFPMFFAVADRIRKAGHEPLNPAEGITDLSQPWEWYMRHAIRMLTYADEMCTLPGWENSPGATWENNIAYRLGITVYEISEMEADADVRRTI